MQPLALKMNNFFRFREEENTIVFDLISKYKDAVANDEITVGDVYEEFVKDPVGYYSNIIEEKGIVNLVAITGLIDGNTNSSNGAGKSTIMEAIGYALFEMVVRKNVNTDKTAKAGMAVVTRNNGKIPEDIRESYVELYFEENGKIYRLKRGRTLTKTQKSNNPCVEFECISDSESLSGHRTGDTNQSIMDVIGIDYDLFVNSVMFGQSDAGKFLTSTDSTRKEMIINVLKLDWIVDGCLDLVRKKIKSAKEVSNDLQNKISSLNEFISDKKSVESIKEDIAVKEKSIIDIDASVLNIESKITELSSSEVLSKINGIESELKKVNDEISSIEKHANDQINEWNKLVDNIVFEGKSLVSKKESINEKIVRLNKDVESKINKVNSFDKNIESYNEEMEKCEKAEKAKPAREAELEKLELEIRKSGEDCAEIRSEIKINQNELDLLEPQLTNIGSENTFRCKSCKSIVSKEHIENEISIYVEKISVSNKKLAEKELALKVVEDKKTDLKRRISNINTYLEKKQILINDRNVYEADKNRIVELKNDLKSLNEEIVEIDKKVDSLREEGRSFKSKIADIKSDQDIKLKDIRETKNNIEKRFTDASAASKDLLDRINVLKSDKQLKLSEKTKYSQEIGSLNNEIKSINDSNEKLKLLNTECKKSMDYIEKLNILDKIYGLDGVQTKIVMKYLPLLNYYIQSYLNVLSNNQMGLSLIINEKSEIDISIVGGMSDSYEFASGGEKVLIRLAISIGLAMLSFARSMIKPAVIFLDEIFGSLDPDKVDGVFNLLKVLQNEFVRVVVISHNPEINDKIKHKMIVEKGFGLYGDSKIKKII